MGNTQIMEAVKVLKEALTGTHKGAALFEEAMSTSDFAPNLGAGFEIQMIDTWKNTPKDYDKIAKRVVLPDFRNMRIGTFLAGTDLLRVQEGEEYKAQPLEEGLVEIGVEKFGRRRGWTWELQLNRMFSALANIPRDFADGALRAENTAALSPLLNGEGGLNTGFFAGAAAPSNLPLNAENLEAVYQGLAQRRGIDGRKTVDLSGLVLVVHPARAFTANRLVNAATIETTVGKTKVTEANPFRGLVEVIAPQTLANLGMDPDTWFLLPGANSSNPALGVAFLQGHESPDIRVKNDQGTRVGGGSIPETEGSFPDDTIDFRVRHVVGGATLFNNAAFASTGKG